MFKNIITVKTDTNKAYIEADNYIFDALNLHTCYGVEDRDGKEVTQIKAISQNG